MANMFDEVHHVGMSPDASIFMEVTSAGGATIEPPIKVVFERIESEDIVLVAFCQGALAARYNDPELREIGEGSSALGMKRIIGDIATNGRMREFAIKPLHPAIVQDPHTASRA
jgi:hypothetical protein